MNDNMNDNTNNNMNNNYIDTYDVDENTLMVETNSLNYFDSLPKKSLNF